MDTEAALNFLTEGNITVLGVMEASSNQAILAELDYNGASHRACYKAEVAERPLWDFPDGLWRREVAAFALDQLLGFDLVPPTIVRTDAPYGVGSLQWWVDDNLEDHYFTLRERPEFLSWFRRLAAFDVVANNADRKSGHILFDEERCWAIDNGLTFNVEDKLRTVVWEFANEPIGDDIRVALEHFLLGNMDALESLLSTDEFVALRQRAQRLLDTGHFPAPDEDGEWPPYPWPLV